jgi:hypothetical protein
LGVNDDAPWTSCSPNGAWDWFDEGVVPVLEALHREHATALPLNVPAGDALPVHPATPSSR